MIRPLRRRHRLMMAMILVLLAIVAALAITHPMPSARVDALPSSIVERPGPVSLR